uniref:CSC1/OSCA1-like 7TM region domain-containing protein n=1 Tax=Nelumbo nucifera TaxID=4432 RepID=A0A822YR96_NELNU|nr:TPA_asm: hypothetical protein HUJ06_012416 [Nelumbo nucifera]
MGDQGRCPSQTFGIRVKHHGGTRVHKLEHRLVENSTEVRKIKDDARELRRLMELYFSNKERNPEGATTTNKRRPDWTESSAEQQVVAPVAVVVPKEVVKSFIQGFLSGIALKIFLLVLPNILMTMSKIEGHTSLSSLERRSAGKYHLFVLVNIFLGSVITGTAFQQLYQFINQPPHEIPKTVGVTIPMKATFFITYVMVDGWAGIAAEILRLFPLIVFHLKNTFLVKTDEEREEAMDAGSIDFASFEPQIQLYFLLGFVYSVVTPVILPFIVIFFALSYVVFRHQIINVYDQKYESGAAFWPDVHRRLVIGLIISQLLLIGLMGTKGAGLASLLIPVPVLTIGFHRFCKVRFESAFVKFPLQVRSSCLSSHAGGMVLNFNGGKIEDDQS